MQTFAITKAPLARPAEVQVFAGWTMLKQKPMWQDAQGFSPLLQTYREYRDAQSQMNMAVSDDLADSPTEEFTYSIVRIEMKAHVLPKREAE